MTSDVLNFLIHGHEKVIGHYMMLLGSPRLSSFERELIEERLMREEEAYRHLTELGDRAAA